MRSAGRTISAASPLAAARARDLVHNSPEAAAMATAFENGVIGDGPSLRPLVEDAALRTALADGFGEWWERAGMSGVEDLATILRLCARELFVIGEFFVHFLVDPQSQELRLRVITSEQLSGLPDRRAETGGWIAKNVEFDQWGRRVAYWVRDDAEGAPEISTRFLRIPADDMIHGFQHLAAGQIRGLSMLAPIATTLHEIATLRDALLAQAKTGALFGGILTNQNGTAGMQPGRAEEIGLEPGGLIQAPPGWEYTQVNPTRSEGSVDFLRANVRAAAAGAGIPYAFVSGDLSDTSYSSAKVGLNEYRRFCVGIQRTLFASRLLQPMWTRWLLVESLAGRIDAEAARQARADFIFPAPRSIDPARETNADRAEALRQQGIVPCRSWQSQQRRRAMGVIRNVLRRPGRGGSAGDAAAGEPSGQSDRGFPQVPHRAKRRRNRSREASCNDRAGCGRSGEPLHQSADASCRASIDEPNGLVSCRRRGDDRRSRMVLPRRRGRATNRGLVEPGRRGGAGEMPPRFRRRLRRLARLVSQRRNRVMASVFDGIDMSDAAAVLPRLETARDRLLAGEMTVEVHSGDEVVKFQTVDLAALERRIGELRDRLQPSQARGDFPLKLLVPRMRGGW